MACRYIGKTASAQCVEAVFLLDSLNYFIDYTSFSIYVSSKESGPYITDLYQTELAYSYRKSNKCMDNPVLIYTVLSCFVVHAPLLR